MEEEIKYCEYCEYCEYCDNEIEDPEETGFLCYNCYIKEYYGERD